MQLPRGGILRHALVTVAAAATIVGLGAGSASAQSGSGQGDVAPAARTARQALADLRRRPGADTTAAYTTARAALADKVAASTGADAATLARDWDATSDQRLLAVYTALAQVGVRYRYASSDPRVGFDCSGLTSYAWAAAGVDLAHSSRAQIRSAAPVLISQVQPGDLVYYPGHVGLAVDDGLVVHAPHPGTTVQVRAMWSKGRVRVGAPTG